MPPNESSDMFVSPRAWSGALASPADVPAADIIDDRGLFRRAEPPKRAMAAPKLAPGTTDRFVINVMSLDLLATVLLQRIYIGVSVTLGTHAVAVTILLMAGRLRFSVVRIILYWLVWAGGFGLLILSGNTYSAASMLLGMICYLPFLAVVPATEQTYFEVIQIFQKIAMLISGLVFLDLVLEIAGFGMPNMNLVVPAGFTSPTMNYIQPLAWHVGIMKPNAFFMLEASYTSQFIAIGLIIELTFFRRWLWLLGFSLALLGTFSGTGLLLAMLALPVLAKRFLRTLLMYGAILLPLLGGVAIATGWLEIALNRVTTFQSKGTSANERFVAPYEYIYDTFSSGDEHKIIYGLGAGKTSFDDAIPGVDNTVSYNVVSRVFLEYGLIILLLVLVFTSYLLFTTGTPFMVSFLIAIQYHIMGGHYLLPPILNYCYILTAGWAITRSDALHNPPFRSSARVG